MTILLANIHALACILFAYLIGSIPSGYLVGRCAGVGDIREYGSGNIGATNVARVLGLKYFYLVFFLDSFKAFSCLSFIQLIGFPQAVILAAASALMVGNGCSLFLNFKGGKGIATGFGILLALQPAVLCYLAWVWLAVFLMTRTVGVASVAVLVALPFCSYQCTSEGPLAVFMVVLSLWCLIRHQSNIRQFLG